MAISPPQRPLWDDGDGNENGKTAKSIGLDWQNNNFACAITLFVHFLAVVALLQRASAKFHVLSTRTGAQDNNFLILFLNFDTVP